MKYYLNDIEHVDPMWKDSELIEQDENGLYTESEDEYVWLVSLNNVLACLTFLAFGEEKE